MSFWGTSDAGLGCPGKAEAGIIRVWHGIDACGDGLSFESP